MRSSVMLHRLRQIADTIVPDSSFTDAVPYIGAAALGAIVDHYFGLVDIIMVLVVLLWCVDFVGGTSRAMLRGARKDGLRGALKSWRWAKAAEGFGKLMAVSLGVLLLGAFELVQLEMVGGYLPLVAPALLAAMVGFGLSIADQIHDLWAEFGTRVRELMKRAIPDQADD